MTSQQKDNNTLLQEIGNHLTGYAIPTPQPIIGAETIQLIVMREILDYTVLRTEETRELNTVVTPTSVTKGEDMIRVAFLASKQKAAESRELERMLRSAVNTANSQIQNNDQKLKIKECFLKDNLCLNCPRCGLYGATSTESGKGNAPNIKHRIEYSTAFSLLSFGDVESSVTFNGIDDALQTTGSPKKGFALGTRYAVLPAKLFPSVITLRGVTKEEFVLVIKTLLATKSYGAETRVGGDVRNHILGIALGWEEVITALELTLELFDVKDSQITEFAVKTILDKYKGYAGNKDRVNILEATKVNSLVSNAQDVILDKVFIETIYKHIADYRSIQTSRG